MRISRVFAVGAGLVCLAGVMQAQKKDMAKGPTFTAVTNDMLMNASKDGKNWVMYGRDYTNQRWSPLKQIHDRNVKDLGVAWMFQTGISRLGSF